MPITAWLVFLTSPRKERVFAMTDTRDLERKFWKANEDDAP